jgi:hypothetical protein
MQDKYRNIIKMATKSCEIVENLKYSGMIIRNQNWIYIEDKGKLNSGSAC